ncbi:MAG: hypothetical protein WBC53_10640 [Phycisphaerae bacterium]
MAGPSGEVPTETWIEAARLAPWGRPSRFRPPHADQAAELARVYARVDEALRPVASSCRACGQCCRFGPATPVLFASTLELAYLVAIAGMPPPERRVVPGPPHAPWQCPYQEGDRCTPREARTLGCRTYFCDLAARVHGERVYAEAVGEIRRIAARRKCGWWYGPARFYFANLGNRGG